VGLKTCDSAGEFEDQLIVDVLPSPVAYQPDTISFSASITFLTEKYAKVDSIRFEFNAHSGNIKEKLFILHLKPTDWAGVSRFKGSYFLKSPILHTRVGSEIRVDKFIYTGKKSFTITRTVGRIE
jgi:hypothetical protein